MSGFQAALTRMRPYSPLVVCLSLGLFTSILSVYFSLDARGYQLTIFGLVLPKTWAYILADFSLFNEYLFKIMVYVLGNSIGFVASMMLMTVFFLTIKLQYLGKVTHHFYLGVFFYACFYLFLLEGTVARAGFATALVMMAIYYLKEEHYWKSLFLILLSTQIHLSAILFLLIFPLYFIPEAAGAVLLVFIAAPLCAVFKISAFSVILEMLGKINSRYLDYSDPGYLAVQNSTGLFFPYIGFFCLLLGVIYWYLREQISSNKFIKTMLLTCMMGISLMWISYDHVAVAARIGELLLIPIVILLCSLELELKKKALFFQRVILYVTSLAYGVARFYYLYIR